MKKISIIVLCFSIFGAVLQAQEVQKPVYTAEQQRLRVTAEDIRLVKEKNPEMGGYHLYVRKRPEIESVLLTETVKDPEGKNDSFAYRAETWNKFNGDEIRYLDGKPLLSEWAKYSLVDSTAEDHPSLGKAFHIYIPEKLVYGYEWERNGTVTIGKGTFINIRTFEKRYADYTGAYMDSPFMFDLIPPPVKEDPPKEELAVLVDDYSPVAAEKFREISENFIYSKGPETITGDIMSFLEKLDPQKPCDLIFVIDATGSMKNDIDTLKEELVPALIEKTEGFTGIRYGLLFYRDYPDNLRYKELPVKLFPLTDDLNVFNKNLNSLVIKGKEGGDIPEAVYEALYAASTFYALDETAWKQVILIGDAEPHPSPRGSRKYSKDFVMKTVKASDVHIDAILLPEEE